MSSAASHEVCAGQIQRRVRRRQNLLQGLSDARLWPSDTTEQAALYACDPYALRAKALDERLTLFEIGRVFLHLNQRRGFLSNARERRKAVVKSKKAPISKTTDTADKPTKPEDMLVQCSQLAEAIKVSGARTLGEFLHWKAAPLRNPDRNNMRQKAAVAHHHATRTQDDRVRSRHTLRSMLEDEFDAIWNSQKKFHTGVLTDARKYGTSERKQSYPCKPRNRNKGESLLAAFGIYGLIFFQRSLKPVPKEIVGLCELEPKAKRCARADRRAQRFRLLQEINNLQFVDPSDNEQHSLNDQQRTILIEYLSSRDTATFTDLRNKLGFSESIKFNLERGKRSGIKGHVVDWLMAKAIGKRWHKFAEDTKNGIVDAAIKNLDDKATRQLIMDAFGLDAADVEAILSVELPAGYVRLSLVAITRLLPHLERGLVYEHRDPSKSARAAAGYDEPWSLQRRIFDHLPDPSRMNPTTCPIGDIPNPVVKRALVEMRKVVNAIVREYGKPNAVHIEMGRDVKTRPKDKSSPAYWRYKQEEEERAEREARRTAAKLALREAGYPYGAGGRNILKYLLRQEQGGVCAYSGKPICLTTLFSDEVEIDHILPRSQSLDDSQMNKVICFSTENHPRTGKGQRTPREWLEHSNPDKYKEVCLRARKLPYSKYTRFLRKEVNVDDFVRRQLNDDRYIAKATSEYVRLLLDHDHDVIGVKGQLTSTLRRLWGLETILSELPDSPAWHEQSNLRPGEKNRADHRHHVIDAIVIALTDRHRLMQLSHGFRAQEVVDKETNETKWRSVYGGGHIDAPWSNFRDDVRQALSHLDGAVPNGKYRRGVSHRVERKVAGELHRDSQYGPTSRAHEFTKRKPLEKLSPNEIDKIRDQRVTRVVMEQLALAGVNVGRGKSADKRKMQSALPEVTLKKSNIPVKKVRLTVPDKTIQPIREGKPDLAYVKPGATHHLCLFAWEEDGVTTWDAAFVTQLEASTRVKRQQLELRLRVKQWKSAGLSADEIKQRSRPVMRDIAHQYPQIQRDAAKLDGEDAQRIPPTARFVMSLSKNESVLLEIDGRNRLFVFDTAASTTRQMTFYPHTAAKHEGKLYGKLTKYPNSFASLKPRKVTVDPIGRIRWAND